MSEGTSIGDLAKATGTKVVTIRYYEKIGLLPEPPRTTDRDCAAVDALALDHLAEIKRKIADLKRLEKELRRISDCCQGGTIGDCRIIEALSAP
jgi:hypothetical protein